MAQDKKTEEREYLNYFLASDEGKEWYRKNGIVSCQDADPTIYKKRMFLSSFFLCLK